MNIGDTTLDRGDMDTYFVIYRWSKQSYFYVLQGSAATLFRRGG